MTSPDDIEGDEPSVRLPSRFDAWGRPTDFLDVDPEVAGQWDASVWHARPPI